MTEHDLNPHPLHTRHPHPVPESHAAPAGQSRLPTHSDQGADEEADRKSVV